MNKVKNIAIYIVALFAVLEMQASEAQRNRIQVAFAPSETYSDLAGMTEEEVESLFSSIRKAFNRYSEWMLSMEYSIYIEVKDIDLPGWVDTSEIDLPKERKFFDMYPPKIEFLYRVGNSSGDIVYEGHRRLVEYDYLNFLVSKDQPDEYFENMIALWSVNDLRKIESLELA